MRRLFLAATLLAVPVAGSERAATVAGPAVRPAATVCLVWWDPERILSEHLDATAREVEAVFRPLGIEIVSRLANGPSEAGELNVVLLSRDPAHDRRHTMGRVNRETGTALWIYTGMVRELLGLAWPSGRNKIWEERRDYPRALGRVVAHEIVHVLVPGQPHALSGLMEASLGRDFLTAHAAPIDRRFASALARRLSAESVEEPARVAADVRGER